nr:hypothetical protein [Glycomyces artemisiae]
MYDPTAASRDEPSRAKWPATAPRRSWSSRPSLWTSFACLARASWRHVCATVRSSAMSVAGDAMTTPRANASSSSSGSPRRAASRNASAGTNSTTSSGVSSNARQYSLPANASACRRRCFACAFSSWSLAASSSTSRAWRYAWSGAFASTTSVRPPDSRTTRSGRTPRPSTEPVCCSEKSQCSTIPAASTIRRSCTSPHWPRTCGDLSAPRSRPVCSRRPSEMSATPESWMRSCA